MTYKIHRSKPYAAGKKIKIDYHDNILIDLLEPMDSAKVAGSEYSECNIQLKSGELYPLINYTGGNLDYYEFLTNRIDNVQMKTLRNQKGENPISHALFTGNVITKNSNPVKWNANLNFCNSKYLIELLYKGVIGYYASFDLYFHGLGCTENQLHKGLRHDEAG